MKKVLGVALIVGLLATAFVMPAEAGKKKAKPRKVEATYGPMVGFAAGGMAGGFCMFNYGADFADNPCVEFVPKASEKYVKVSVTDATGTKVFGFISQGDVDGDGVGDGYGTFCGAHKRAEALQGGATPVRVSFYPGACEDGSPSLPTTGKVTVLFSAKPF